jgi:hypothetical protein
LTYQLIFVNKFSFLRQNYSLQNLHNIQPECVTIFEQIYTQNYFQMSVVKRFKHAMIDNVPEVFKLFNILYLPELEHPTGVSILDVV